MPIVKEVPNFVELAKAGDYVDSRTPSHRKMFFCGVLFFYLIVDKNRGNKYHIYMNRYTDEHTLGGMSNDGCAKKEKPGNRSL